MNLSALPNSFINTFGKAEICIPKSFFPYFFYFPSVTKLSFKII